MPIRSSKVWLIRIVSVADEQTGDRYYANGKRYIQVTKLPVRAEYRIEGAGIRKAESKALKLAAEDGIERAKVLSAEWINSPYGRVADDDRRFEEFSD